MRLFIRHAIALLMFLFVFRLAIQAQAHQPPPNLPKSVLLSRLAKNDPIPSRLDQTPILKAISQESEGFVDRKISSRNRK